MSLEEFRGFESLAMSDPIDYVAASQVVQQSGHSADDETGVTAAPAHAPDDISMSYVSKEVSQAMSYSATAEEMKSDAARIQSTTVIHAPVGAQDAHTLQANSRSKNPELDEKADWKDDIYDEASKIRQVQSLKGETSGASEVTHDKPDLDKFEFPVAPAAAVRPPTSNLKPRFKPVLQALTLPNEQSPQPSPHGSEQGDSGRESPTRTPVYVQHALLNKKPPRALTRLKTRLQEPPPMTPAVSALIARGHFSNSPDQDQPLMTSRGLPTSRKVGTLSRVASFAAATPGKLRTIASALFTPRGGAASTPAGFQPPEEEVDLYQKLWLSSDACRPSNSRVEGR